MIKLLHGADFHLDSPFAGKTEEQSCFLKQKLLELPAKMAEVCRKNQCDLVLLAGDIFDGNYTKESYVTLRRSLEEMQVPVYISPGNHDFCSASSPWVSETWPENVHIFKKQTPESVVAEGLDCRIYGAGFQSMDCPGLLEDFHAEGKERYQIGVFHGDPAQASSPYCPITAAQVRDSGLDYLALGHIHKGNQFRAGNTLCAWPGSPMGRGFDETGEKGLLLVTIDKTAKAEPVLLDMPKFYDCELEAGNDPEAALEAFLPGAGNKNFYRISLTGYSAGVDLKALYQRFSAFPNLLLQDQTLPDTDLWAHVGEDTLEGVYFGKLKKIMDHQPPDKKELVRLAAEISRRILDGQEVKLP